MPIEINALESDRFGIVAARLTSSHAPLDAVDAAAEAANVDLIISRIDATEMPRIHALEECGFRLMDTLVYYQRTLDEGLVTTNAVPEASLRLATVEDIPAVSSIARAAFTNYVGHYHTDPRLDNSAADAAYVEWAENSVASMSAHAPVLVACDESGPVGFLTLRLNAPDEFEILLNAVHSDVQGKGLYTALIAGALELARKAEANRVIVSTQISNYGVQRVWSRAGFVHYRSVYTLHKWYQTNDCSVC